jgi:hypothetical protein
MHRKTREFPVGQLVAALAVLALAIAMVATVVGITDTPTAGAPAWQAQTAAMLAHDAAQLHHHP